MTDNPQVTSLQQVVSEETAHPAHEDQPFEERLEGHARYAAPGER